MFLSRERHEPVRNFEVFEIELKEQEPGRCIFIKIQPSYRVLLYTRALAADSLYLFSSPLPSLPLLSSHPLTPLSSFHPLLLTILIRIHPHHRPPLLPNQPTQIPPHPKTHRPLPILPVLRPSRMRDQQLIRHPWMAILHPNQIINSESVLAVVEFEGLLAEETLALALGELDAQVAELANACEGRGGLWGGEGRGEHTVGKLFGLVVEVHQGIVVGVGEEGNMVFSCVFRVVDGLLNGPPALADREIVGPAEFSHIAVSHFLPLPCRKGGCRTSQ